jgi:D-ribose pyranose/furanose isomerase RbsD
MSQDFVLGSRRTQLLEGPPKWITKKLIKNNLARVSSSNNNAISATPKHHEQTKVQMIQTVKNVIRRGICIPKPWDLCFLCADQLSYPPQGVAYR